MKHLPTSTAVLILFLMLPGFASAATPTWKDGATTTSNWPELTWDAPAEEQYFDVRIAKSAPVSIDGSLVQAVQTFDAISGLGLGKDSEWQNSYTAALFPGTYYWQVRGRSYNIDGTEILGVWSSPIKLTVIRKAGRLKAEAGEDEVVGDNIFFPFVMKIDGNIKEAPLVFYIKLNGKRICSANRPLVRDWEDTEYGLKAQIKRTVMCSYHYKQVKKNNMMEMYVKVGSFATTGRKPVVYRRTVHFKADV